MAGRQHWRNSDDAAGHGAADGRRHGADVDHIHVDGLGAHRRRVGSRSSRRQRQRHARAVHVSTAVRSHPRTGTHVAKSAGFRGSGGCGYRLRRFHFVGYVIPGRRTESYLGHVYHSFSRYAYFQCKVNS